MGASCGQSCCPSSYFIPLYVTKLQGTFEMRITETLFCTLLIACFAVVSAQDSEFAQPTIDIGCVVSDIDASVRFYTAAIGFKETGGFQVSADYATDVGLTDNKMLDVKILTLGEGDGATQLKLMQIKGESIKPANDFINATLGFSYITVKVKSTDAALARLKKASVKPIAKCPQPLPAMPAIALTIVRDPDGNLIELVGPIPKE